MLKQDHPLFIKTQRQIEARLKTPGPVGGYIRYEQDHYFKSTDLSNPWFITTLWEVERILHQPTVTLEDLQYVEQILNWTLQYKFQSGVLAEQLNPYTGESLSATPLVWSHAVYVETVLLYIERKKELENFEQQTAKVMYEL
jgi:GH15 family glucan-1,4-alpha-glucosidase